MIHGAWHGGWCFDRLRPLLEVAGHSMTAPDLPGMGDDAKALAGVTLDGWADFVIETARVLAGPVILCGHSRGGIVISQAAERAPDLFATLVYISAVLARDGDSLYDTIASRPENPDFAAGLRPVADGLGVAVSAAPAIATFYGLCDPADQQLAVARLLAEPVRPLGTPVRTSAERFGTVPRHYVECRHDRTFPLDLQRAMQAALPCASVTTLESDHSPFLSVPEQLAAALITIAERIET